MYAADGRMECCYGPGCLIKIANSDHDVKFAHNVPNIMTPCTERHCKYYARLYSVVNDISEESTFSDEMIRRASRHVAMTYHAPIGNDDPMLQLSVLGTRCRNLGSHIGGRSHTKDIVNTLQLAVDGESVPPPSPDNSPLPSPTPSPVPKLMLKESPGRVRFHTIGASPASSSTTSPASTRSTTPSPKEDKPSPKGISLMRKAISTSSSERATDDIKRELMEQNRKITRLEADIDFIKNALTQLLKNSGQPSA